MITDPLDTRNIVSHRLRLLRRAARCKIAGDRFSNVFTIIEACDSYVDAIRKLDETIEAGWQLLLLGQLADLGPIAALDHLENLYQTNRFEALLGMVPLIAEVEKQLLLIQFSQEFFKRMHESEHPNVKQVVKAISDLCVCDRDLRRSLYDRSKEKNEPWLAELLDKINRELIIEDGKEPVLPYWLKRLCYLGACYRPPRRVIQISFPTTQLSDYMGLAHFISDTRFANLGRPLESRDFIPYIKDIYAFLRTSTIGYGVLPGIGDIVFPISTDPNQLLLRQRLLDKMRHSPAQAVVNPDDERQQSTVIYRDSS